MQIPQVVNKTVLAFFDTRFRVDARIMIGISRTEALLLCTGIRSTRKLSDMLFRIDRNSGKCEVILDTDDDNGYVEGMFYEPESKTVMLNIAVGSDDTAAVWEETTLKIQM